MDSKVSRRIVWTDTEVAARTVTARLVPIEPECVTDLSSGRDHTGTFDQHDFVTQHEDLDVFRCI